MATITKRMTKSGPSYRIQVKMRDKGSGKLNVHSTTWRPPAGLTPKQIEREVVIYADKYESELKMSLTAPGAEGLSPDTTVRDYANWWLERRKDELSASYYVNCKVAIQEIAACIGGYKLREINPTIIQRFYDQLDKKEKTVTTVTAKPELREAMQEAQMGFRKLRYEMDFNCATLAAALAGKKSACPTLNGWRSASAKAPVHSSISQRRKSYTPTRPCTKSNAHSALYYPMRRSNASSTTTTPAPTTSTFRNDRQGRSIT